MELISLNGVWQVSGSDGSAFEGSVPGCVHTDQFSAQEMFFEDNARQIRSLEQNDYCYRRTFSLAAVGEDPVLVFEGLDTYCSVFLNGTKLGDCDDMFLEYRFPVQGILRGGENELLVAFRSPVREVADRPARSGAFTTERLYTRRMQCTYGWDWVERFVTCGIYRPVHLEMGGEMYADRVYCFTESVDSYSAQLKIAVHLRHPQAGGIVSVQVLAGETPVASATHYCAEPQLVLHLDVPEPQLWYPAPYGSQPLYTLRVTVGEQVLEELFGIRTVKILQLPDASGSAEEGFCRWLQRTPSGREYDENERFSGFILLVNGVRIFCTGANWVPCEPFPSAETPEKITLLLEKARQIGINMLRVWGGGIFEQEHFYRECTRLGILVTQDMLMACGDYPEEDSHFAEQLRQETVQAARRLRNHTCLVWWSGDNENSVDGWDTETGYRGRTAARRIIAPALEQEDYARPFLYSSPYGGRRYASKTVGTTHNTQFLGSTFAYMEQEDLSDYRNFFRGLTARFIAEEPSMGAVMPETLHTFIATEHEERYDLWLAHTKGNPSLPRELLDMMLEFADKLFGRYTDFADRYFKARYLQYEWVRLTVENARRHSWFCSGILYWMLDDCWPAAMGWSLLDYIGRHKGGAWALRHHATPCTLTLENGMAFVSNILPTEERAMLTVQRIALDSGAVSTVITQETTFASGCTEVAFSADMLSADEVLVATLTAKQSVRTFYVAGCPQLTPCRDAVRVSRKGQWLELSAARYVHVVELCGAEEVSDNYFSLLPGEKKQVHFSGAEPMWNAYTLRGKVLG